MVNDAGSTRAALRVVSSQIEGGMTTLHLADPGGKIEVFVQLAPSQMR